MHEQILSILAAVMFSGLPLFAAETEPELFRITPEDEGKLSKEFIALIRSGVGDEKASRASAELDDFVLDLLEHNRPGHMSYEDVKCEYLNYLQRLYDKALRAAADSLPPGERAALLEQEADWRKNGCSDHDCTLCDRFGKPLIDIDPRERQIRLVLNRTRYLESPPERRAELARFHGLRVRYVRGDLPVEYNELRRETPLDLDIGNRQALGKTYIEEIATLPPQFCREVRIGKDLYQMGILIPTNDVCYERSTQGYERILVIWRNGEHHAHYYLPDHARIQETQVHGTQISVRYVQCDEYDSEVKHAENAGQTFTIDFTYHIFAPVRITNWLDYYMDGLGNIHVDGCCKDKFRNSDI